MGMANFLNTVNACRRNPLVSTPVAVARHILWQFRKAANAFPCELAVAGIKVRIANRAVANGCGGLLNAMGFYDPNNMGLLREAFRKGVFTSFVDVGANIGVYSLIVAQHPKARVYSFEPHPATRALLDENVSFNGWSDRVTTFAVALSSSAGNAWFSEKPASPLNRVLPDGTTGGILVPSARGDELLRQLGVVPEVVKIDVEGFEEHVLAGLRGVLSSVQLLLLECHSFTPAILSEVAKADLAGPYKFDILSGHFGATVPSHEDHVFVSRRGREVLERECGFTFECNVSG